MKLFREIASCIPTIGAACDIAVDLLESIEPIGGRDWVLSRKAEGGMLDPQQVTHDVLEHWCQKSPDTPYGDRLHDVLHDAAPRIAERFSSDLLSSE